jgi:GMP synthase (glutamine-hydrolysing)
MTKKTIILIDHPVSQRDDRASTRLAAKGYHLEWCCPGKGEPLPEVGPRHVAAVVYGGAESANDGPSKPYIAAELKWIEDWLATGKPYLGFCLGSQMLAHVLGGRVAPHPKGWYEIGYVPVEATPAADGLSVGLSHVYHWHKEGFEVPACGELLFAGPVFPNQAFRYGTNAYGLQFHPEVGLASISRWMREASHMLENPNAHKPERQLADAAKYDAPLEAWLDRFLDRWIKDAG